MISEICWFRITSNWSPKKDSRTIKLKELTARRKQAKLKTPQHERSDTATSRRKGHDDSDDDESDSRESSPEKQKHAATPTRREKEKKLGWFPSHLCQSALLDLCCVIIRQTPHTCGSERGESEPHSPFQVDASAVV